MDDNIVIYKKYTQFTFNLVSFHILNQVFSSGVVRWPEYFDDKYEQAGGNLS